MATTAVVYVLASDGGRDKAILINSDGYPEQMVPALENVVAQGKLGEFVSHPEYSFVAKDAAQYDASITTMRTERYLSVEGVGFAFKDPIKLGIVYTAAGEVDVKAHAEDHAYIVRAGSGTVEVV